MPKRGKSSPPLEKGDFKNDKYNVYLLMNSLVIKTGTEEDNNVSQRDDKERDRQTARKSC